MGKKETKKLFMGVKRTKKFLKAEVAVLEEENLRLYQQLFVARRALVILDLANPAKAALTEIDKLEDEC